MDAKKNNEQLDEILLYLELYYKYGNIEMVEWLISEYKNHDKEYLFPYSLKDNKKYINLLNKCLSK